MTHTQVNYLGNYLVGHEYFACVPEEFVEDDFNLTGLSSVVPLYGQALDTILDMELDKVPEPDGTAVYNTF